MVFTPPGQITVPACIEPETIMLLPGTLLSRIRPLLVRLPPTEVFLVVAGDKKSRVDPESTVKL